MTSRSANTATVKYGTVLSSGATASYPSSFIASPQYNPSNGNDGSSSGKLSGGAIAGIAVASVAAVLLAAMIIFLLCSKRRRKAKKQKKRESQTHLLPPPAVSTGSCASTSSNSSHPPVMGPSGSAYGSTNVLPSQPEMSEHRSGGGVATPAPIASIPPTATTRNKNRLQVKTGLSFGKSGHKRTESANSTTPFIFPAAGDPSSPSYPFPSYDAAAGQGVGRPSTDSNYYYNSNYSNGNRYSMETTTSYPGSPPNSAGRESFDVRH